MTKTLANGFWKSCEFVSSQTIYEKCKWKIIFLLLFSFFFSGCGDIENYRNKEADRKNRLLYRLRLLACVIPYSAQFQSDGNIKFNRSTRYGISYFRHSDREGGHPNLAIWNLATSNWKYISTVEPILDATIWDEFNIFTINDKKLFSSSDAGTTWSEQQLPNDSFLKKYTVVSNSSKLYLYAVGQNSLQIITEPSENLMKVYSTRDRGSNWTIREFSGKELLHYSQQGGVQRILISEAGLPQPVKLFTSTDEGLTWVEKYTFASGTGKNYLPSYLWFKDSLNGFASGGTSIFKTSDGGNTWTEFPQAFPYDYTSVLYYDGSTIYASKYFSREADKPAGNSFQGEFSQSTDGLSWTQWDITPRQINEVFSESDILARSISYISVYNSFKDVGKGLPWTRFSYQKQATLWETHWVLCWMSLLSAPDTGNRDPDRN